MTEISNGSVRIDDIGYGVEVDYDGEVDIVFPGSGGWGSAGDEIITLTIEDLERVLAIARARRDAYEQYLAEIGRWR
jgi:hypothetical protein